MKTAVTTIQFNTGRKYTAEGQIITATLYSDGAVTFMDHSRMIDGEFSNQDSGLLSLPEYRLGGWELHLRGAVVSAYDNGKHESTKRSRADGMMTGGRNTRDGFEVLTKLAKMAKPEEHKDRLFLAAMWSEFCAEFGFDPIDANELLAAIADTKTGEAWRLVKVWVMDFIMVWEGVEEDQAEEWHVLGDGDVVLEICASRDAAESFVHGYTRHGNWGGYSFIHIGNKVTGEAKTFTAPEAEELGGLGVSLNGEDE